jgi:hypothetical protein
MHNILPVGLTKVGILTAGGAAPALAQMPTTLRARGTLRG